MDSRYGFETSVIGLFLSSLFSLKVTKMMAGQNDEDIKSIAARTPFRRDKGVVVRPNSPRDSKALDLIRVEK